MNAYSIVMLIALLVDYVVHTIAAFLNVEQLSQPVPDDVAVLYGEQELNRARRYVRAATWEGLIECTVLLLALLLFLFSGGFAWVDSVVGRWFTGELLRGLAFLGLIGLAYAVLSLPFDIYRTFMTETRFGFNRTTWRTFAADRAKGLTLTVVLGGALLTGVLLLFLNMGSSAWLLCWLLVVAFSLAVQWLGPALILPLFNRFEPMPEGQLKDAIVRYADSVRFPLQNVYLIDGSRRSTKANAFFSGFGRHRRIAIFDTLAEKHSVAEIVSVLAHEVGHYQLRHITKGIVLGAAHSGLALYLLSLLVLRPQLHHALLVAEPSLHVGMVGFMLLYTPVELVLSAVENYVSRRHEYAADRYALDTSREPESLADALKTLSVVNPTHPIPHPLQVVLSYSHPPLVQRLHSIETHLAGTAGGRDT